MWQNIHFMALDVVLSHETQLRLFRAFQDGHPFRAMTTQHQIADASFSYWIRMCFVCLLARQGQRDHDVANRRSAILIPVLRYTTKTGVHKRVTTAVCAKQSSVRRWSVAVLSNSQITRCTCVSCRCEETSLDLTNTYSAITGSNFHHYATKTFDSRLSCVINFIHHLSASSFIISHYHFALSFFLSSHIAV